MQLSGLLVIMCKNSIRNNENCMICLRKRKFIRSKSQALNGLLSEITIQKKFHQKATQWMHTNSFHQIKKLEGH